MNNRVAGVAAASSAAALPVTGPEVLPFVAGAVGSVLLGIALLRSGRRKAR